MKPGLKTGLRGAFVIAWAQCQVDGQSDALPEALRAGASWSWEGEAIRVDGPASVLLLADTPGAGDLRLRAARSVQKLRGEKWAAIRKAGPGQGDPCADMPQGDASDGFTVTDGRICWPVGIIPATPGRDPLLLFQDDLPPREAELWVVSPPHTALPARAPAPAGGVICFTTGTLIQTEQGPRPVEQLASGDLVQTKDDGLQPLLWIGSRRLTGARLYAMPHLRPVRLLAGALGSGIPDAPLSVSPDHRILLRGPRARSLFNCDEVLVAARDLLNGRTVVIDHGLREVTYLHLLLPSHQIVFANAVETESFHPAGAALDQMDPAQRAALDAVLGGVIQDPQSYGGYSRRMLSRGDAAILQHDAA